MYGNPLQTLFEFTPLFVLFPIFYLIIREILDYKTRKTLIDKGMDGEEAKILFKSTVRSNSPTSLKWGMIFILIGFAMVLVRMFEDVAAEIYLGVMLIAGGLALLIYYFIVANLRKKENK